MGGDFRGFWSPEFGGGCYIIPNSYIIDVFKKIRFVKEHRDSYILGPDRIPVSIEDLIWVVSDMYDLKIEVLKVSAKAQSLRGVLLRYEEKPSQILVRADLDEFRKRFVIVKELAHLIIDQKEDWSPDGVKIIDDLFKLFELENGGANAEEHSIRVVSEQVAEIVATELLYPAEFRNGNEQDLISGKTSFAKLEIQYAIPASVINRAHGASYKQICAVGNSLPDVA